MLLRITCVIAALTLGAWAEGEGQQVKPDVVHEGMGEDQHHGRGHFKTDLLKRFDKDGDGKLSEEELAAAEAARKEMMERKALERFTAIDTDGNGCISKEEWLAHAKQMAKEQPHRGPGDKKHKDHGNNGVGNGEDPAPPGNPPVNDGPGTGPGDPGNKNDKPETL